MTSTNIFINVIKNDRTLDTLRSKNYSKRSFLSSFSYIPEIVPSQSGFMLFGGKYGGLSFQVGKWIEKD